MRLPKLVSAPGRTRKQIFEFGGINFGDGASDGEFAITENVSSELYPSLSPRPGRSVRKTLSSPGGIYAGDDLFYIDGDTIYRNGEELGKLASAEGGPRKLLLINSKLVVFPDKVYFNIEDKENYEVTHVAPTDWEKVYTEYFTYDEDAEEYFPVPEADTAPYWTGDRYYRYVSVHPLAAETELFGGTVAFEANKIKLLAESGYRLKKGDLYVLGPYERIYTYDVAFECSDGSVTLTQRSSGTWSYNVSEGDFVQLIKKSDGTYTVKMPDSNYQNATNYKLPCVVEKIVDSYYSEDSDGDITSDVTFEARLYETEEFEYSFGEGFCDFFRPGDAVKISGCALNTENNMTLIIRDVTPTELIFDDNVFTANSAGYEVGDITLSREVPDFDVVCEHNNRLYGADGEKIYASALGDPTNWNVFDGLATDSYTVAVASAGKFTGCTGYSGSVIFFKEDMMYKLMGDYPSNFALYGYNVAGVAEGSAESLVNINERLFYHSRDGVYVYTGSVPQLISYRFGTKRFKDAVAAGFGTKYYISMRERENNPSAAVGGTSRNSWETLASGLYVYDTLRDIWLREDDTEVLGFAECGGEYLMLTSDGALIQLEAGADNTVEWSAETCELSEYIQNRKCYSKLLLRLDMDAGSSAAVEISCDRGEWKTVWVRSVDESGASATSVMQGVNSVSQGEGEYRNFYTANIPIRPTRCDRFSIRISGVGTVIIRSLVREYEIGSET